MKQSGFDKKYELIPMDKIDPFAREIAKRWYDGVSEMNDIREKHKLASDIMNYAAERSAILVEALKKIELLYPKSESFAIINHNEIRQIVVEALAKYNSGK